MMHLSSRGESEKYFPPIFPLRFKLVDVQLSEILFFRLDKKMGGEGVVDK